MKTIHITIISFITGIALTYFTLNTINSTINQRSLESQIILELDIIKLANEGNSQKIQALLKAVNACHATEYKKELESFFWKKSKISSELLERSKQNMIDNQGCDKWAGVKKN